MELLREEMDAVVQDVLPNGVHCYYAPGVCLEFSMMVGTDPAKDIEVFTTTVRKAAREIERKGSYRMADALFNELESWKGIAQDAKITLKVPLEKE